MTRLPNNPMQELYCRFCRSGMFLGNGTACYVCMHLAGREDLGKPKRQAVADKGCTVPKVVEDPVGDWVALVAGLTKRLTDAKLQLEAARKAHPLAPLTESQQKRMAEIEQADKDWLAGLQQEQRAKHMPAPLPMVPAGTVHIPLSEPIVHKSGPGDMNKDEGLMKRIGRFLAEPASTAAVLDSGTAIRLRPVGAIDCTECTGTGVVDGQHRPHDCSVCAGRGWVLMATLFRPPAAVDCVECKGEGHTVRSIEESPTCRFECSACAGRGWVIPKRPKIVHEDDGQAPLEVRRAGGQTICDVCGMAYQDHQEHQFGTGIMPLFLHELCPGRRSGPSTRFVKL